MKVAVIQMNAGGNKQENVARAIFLVERAIENRAKFILLPEAYSFRGPLSAGRGGKAIAENIPGESTRPFMKIAQEKKVSLLLGSLYEKAPDKQKAYNTSVLINDLGRIQAKYRKINLFDAVLRPGKIRESRRFLPGRSTATAMVDNLKIGMAICFDLRFPELFRKYFHDGVQVFCVPSSFTKKTGEAHWEVLLRARAIESLSYVLAPNQFGQDGHGMSSYGHSLIIDPWGKVIARASATKEEILYADIEQRFIQKARASFPGMFRFKR